MKHESTENMKLVMQTITAALLTVLTAINGWALTKIVEHDQELAMVVTRFEAFAGIGDRYTREDANSDLGHIVEKVNDHELRIRILEK